MTSQASIVTGGLPSARTYILINIYIFADNIFFNCNLPTVAIFINVLNLKE